MKGNRFSISLGWPARSEGPAELGERLIKTLDALSAISPLLRPWWLFNSSLAVGDAWKDETAEHYFPLDYARTHMTEIVQMGVQRDDYDYPTPEGGYWTTACNHTDLISPGSVKLRVYGAGSIGPFSAAFATDDDQGPDPALVAYPLFKSVLTTLVSHWDVSDAQAYSSDLSGLWSDPRLALDLAWMTYLSAPLANRIDPPRGALVEHTDDGGLLLIAAEQTFDVKNRKHVAAARSIVDCLAPVNALKEEQWAARWPLLLDRIRDQ